MLEEASKGPKIRMEYDDLVKYLSDEEDWEEDDDDDLDLEKKKIIEELSRKTNKAITKKMFAHFNMEYPEKEEKDPTKFTEEEYYQMLEEASNEIKNGKFVRLEDYKDFNDFIKKL